MMRRLLAAILRRLVIRGCLTVRWPDGSMDTFRGAPGQQVMVAIRDAATVRDLVLNPSLAVGEAYMNGSLAAIEGDIYSVMEFLCANLALNGGAAHPAL